MTTHTIPYGGNLPPGYTEPPRHETCPDCGCPIEPIPADSGGYECTGCGDEYPTLGTIADAWTARLIIASGDLG